MYLLEKYTDINAQVSNRRHWKLYMYLHIFKTTKEKFSNLFGMITQIMPETKQVALIHSTTDLIL